MKWYHKYECAFEKPYESVSEDIISNVSEKLKAMRCNSPEVSIVLIAHNEQDRILSCIWSLCDNIINRPTEIIVADNNSTDKTQEILDRIGIEWFEETKKGPGFARQCGLDHAKGKYHLCIDSDTLYPPYYVITHIHALEKKEVSCAFSLWSFLPSNKYPYRKLFWYELIRDVFIYLQYIRRPELCVRGMAFSFKTEEARQIGFRTDIIRGEDGSLAFALKPSGKIFFISSRKARVITNTHIFDIQNSSIFYTYTLGIKKVMNIFRNFFKRAKYIDTDSNLLK